MGTGDYQGNRGRVATPLIILAQADKSESRTSHSSRRCWADHRSSLHHPIALPHQSDLNIKSEGILLENN